MAVLQTFAISFNAIKDFMCIIYINAYIYMRMYVYLYAGLNFVIIMTMLYALCSAYHVYVRTLNVDICLCTYIYEYM